MDDKVTSSIALAVGLSSLVTVLFRRLRLPALIPLMLTGLAFGASGLNIIDMASASGVLKSVITVAIGLLIFEGALHLNKHELSRSPRAVWGLITIGALVTWITVALIGHFFLGLTWPVSLLLGAILIVTGPTVVQPILRLIHVSPRIQSVLAAEAVLIDPIGVVATITTLEVIRLSFFAGPATFSASQGIWLFAVPLLGGAGVGVAMGLLGYLLLGHFSRSGKFDGGTLGLLSLGICMSAVGLGERVAPEGGLAAVTVSGVIMARSKAIGLTELRSFKQMLATIAVGTLFVILSSRFELQRLFTLDWKFLVFVPILVFIVRPLNVFASCIKSGLTFREQIFAGTFAPRGIVALSAVVIVVEELNRALVTSAGSADQVLHAGVLADLQRLEPLVFLSIAGSVLLATIISPCVAWILGLHVGEGKAVIIVGGHSLGIALASLLKDHGVAVRIIDSSASRVAEATAVGLDAVCGDATDSRWLDDVGAPNDAGCLIAWTGNHDVDQLAARWSVERFGDRKTMIWSSKPVRGSLATCRVFNDEPIGSVLRQFDNKEVNLHISERPHTSARSLGTVITGTLIPGVVRTRSTKSMAMVVSIDAVESLPADQQMSLEDPTSTSLGSR